MKWIHVALAVCLPLLLAACGESRQETEPSAPQGFHIAQAEWEQQRREELIQPDGWASLIGLHWLQLKVHFIGSGEKSGIRIAIGPDRLGKVEQREGRVFFTPEKGIAVTVDGVPLKGTAELKNDRSKDGPSVLGYDEGKGRITVIERAGRQALRVKHADAPGRTHFAGLEYWTADPAWRIEGRFVAHPPGRTIPIADIIGVINETPNPGAVEFEKDGRSFRLEALAYADDALFFVFADRTSGHGSYPAGRFLDTGLPDAAGRLVLDFNRAYNPPCAFTPFATCPLPPPENRLDLAVTAGEKHYVPPPDAALQD